MNDLIAFLGDYTIQNVLMGAALLGIASGALGSFAVLRQQSLLGDTLSHATLPGVALGFIVVGSRHLGSIMLGALISGGVAALLVLLLINRSRLKTDAALGTVLSTFFALGVVLLTFIQQSGNASQGGLDTFLFGQAAAILRSDLVLMGALTLLSILLVLALWKEFKLVTFDAAFAASLGMPVLVIEVVLTLTIALAIVIGLQLVGVVLMAAMVVAPAVAARQWTARLGPMVVLSAAIGAAGGMAGAVVSASGSNLATGPLMVLGVTFAVVVSIVLAPHRGMLWAWRDRLRAAADYRERRLLTVLRELGEEHGDPYYPAEHGTIRAVSGAGTGPGMRHLEEQGLVERTSHMPEEGTHWKLTEEGRAEAEEALSAGDGKGPDR